MKHKTILAATFALAALIMLGAAPAAAHVRSLDDRLSTTAARSSASRSPGPTSSSAPMPG